MKDELLKKGVELKTSIDVVKLAVEKLETRDFRDRSIDLVREVRFAESRILEKIRAIENELFQIAGERLSSLLKAFEKEFEEL